MKIKSMLRNLSLERVKARLNDRYRPELHYMRGPGPKCAETARRGSPTGRGGGDGER